MRKIVFMLATMMMVSFGANAVESTAVTTPQSVAQDQKLEIKLTPGQATAARDVSYSFDFGSVMVGMSSYRSFTLSNSGNMNLFVDSIRMHGADFTASGNCPSVLRPGDYCVFDVRFSPWIEGFKSGAMYISTNGGLVSLHFSGWANRRW